MYVGKCLQIIIAIVCVFAAQMSLAECSNDTLRIRHDRGTVKFSVELAQSPQEHAVGLMNRESMPSGHGMLFLYPTPRHVHFWMRNTFIPLDILFIDATGVIAKVHHNATPLDETPIPSDAMIQYVLEINAGLAKKYRISKAAQIQHPLILTTPVWPCH
jgi:uncharacterized membrane protein (UPF0127 family)